MICMFVHVLVYAARHLTSPDVTWHHLISALAFSHTAHTHSKEAVHALLCSCDANDWLPMLCFVHATPMITLPYTHSVYPHNRLLMSLCLTRLRPSLSVRPLCCHNYSGISFTAHPPLSLCRINVLHPLSLSSVAHFSLTHLPAFPTTQI